MYLVLSLSFELMLEVEDAGDTAQLLLWSCNCCTCVSRCCCCCWLLCWMLCIELLVCDAFVASCEKLASMAINRSSCLLNLSSCFLSFSSNSAT